MNNNRINIIKHIEEKEGKDIFQDYDEILIFYIDKEGDECLTYSLHKDHIIKCRPKEESKNIFEESIYGVDIKNKSQIANRIQYIKQSGYIFKEYFVSENSLTIVFE